MFGLTDNKSGNKGIYNREIFVNNKGEKMTHTQEVSTRRKIRAKFLSACEKICTTKVSNDFLTAFLADYRKIFAVNDFSVSSVTESKNESNRETITNALAKVKKFAEKQNAPETK